MRQTNVVIGIITCLRPAGLSTLLDSIAQLSSDIHDVQVSLIVVDNDPAGSAREVVMEHAARGLYPVKYIVETRAGIPYARNTVVEAASGAADFLVFVDDDEFVETNWLASLLSVQEAFDADVVTGPVLPVYSPETPRWIVDGDLFARGRRRSGTKLRTAATNNTLVRMQVFENHSLRFDTRLALSGGSDTHLFLRVADAGHQIVWADDAIVYETVPAQRATAKWLLQRQFRKGILDGFLREDRSASRGARARVVLRGLARVAKGLLLCILCAPQGRKGQVAALQRIARGVGAVGYALGYRYDEYKSVHMPSHQDQMARLPTSSAPR